MAPRPIPAIHCDGRFVCSGPIPLLMGVLENKGSPVRAVLNTIAEATVGQPHGKAHILALPHQSGRARRQKRRVPIGVPRIDRSPQQLFGQLECRRITLETQQAEQLKETKPSDIAGLAAERDRSSADCPNRPEKRPVPGAVEPEPMRRLE